MTRDELRQIIKQGDEKLKNSIAWRMMSGEQRQLLLAGEQFWSEDSDVTNAALDAMIAIYDNIPPQKRGDLYEEGT